MNRIDQGNFPQKYFNDQSIKRISSFRLDKLEKGVAPIIGKRLIKMGLIQVNNKGELTKLTRQVFNIFADTIKPHHDHVLKYILREDKNSIATEIPIWNTKPQKITGHIDLLRVNGDIIQVADYKPEGNFIRSIPQVAFYGFTLKNKFKYNVKCISFNKDKEWVYDPEMVLKSIDEMLITNQINKKFDWQFFV